MAGAVVTSSTSTSTRISDFSNLYIVYQFNQQRAVVTQRLLDRTEPLCGTVLPAMQTPHVCNQALRQHAWSRYLFKSTPVVPWIVTVSVLHGVRDVLFPRSCLKTRNRSLSLVKWLHGTLKTMVNVRTSSRDWPSRFKRSGPISQ